MNINIIAASATNNVIGNEGKMLWYIPADLRRFQKLTIGKTIVMGRKTWESLPIKPLPNRRNIVVSRGNVEGNCEVYHNVESVLKACKDESEVFVIGGEQIYWLFLPLASKIYLTKVEGDFCGDTYFPDLYDKVWQRTYKSGRLRDNNSGVFYHFENYERVR